MTSADCSEPATDCGDIPKVTALPGTHAKDHAVDGNGAGNAQHLAASAAANADIESRPALRARTPTTPGATLAIVHRGGVRLDWATLSKRVHGIDALKCSRCDAGRLESIAVITDRHVARKILEHVGEWTEPQSG